MTVIEAGPCPVVQLKTEETDGYEAVQLAFEEVPERKVTKPRLGHLKKTDTKPHRHLVEFRGQSEAVVGEPVTVEVFEPGDAIKVTGISIGKGFAGTIKRHNFSRGPVTHGSHNIRKRGSDRLVRDALARVQGHEDGRPDGRQACDPGRA